MTLGEDHPLDLKNDPLRLGVHPQPGHVWLVGAGPGDAGLLTIRGWTALLGCDVVVHDRLGCEEILCRLPGHIRRVNVGKQPGERMMTQERINAILTEEALAGNRVVRLKGGDPFVFGRGSEEVAHLRQHGVPVQIVPGVSSAIAGAGTVGVPVTHRAVARSFVVSTGRDESGQVASGTSADTHVYLMGIEALPEIVASLRAKNLTDDTPAVVVASASTYRQKFVRATLGTVADAVRASGVNPPAVLLVGPTAGEDVAPHLGLNPGGVLVTGSRIPAGLELAAPGAPVLWRPLFTARFLESPTDRQALDNALLPNAWIVFHGVPSVDGWLHELNRAGLDLRRVRSRLAAIGTEAARALERWHIQPDALWAQEDVSQMAQVLGGAPVWLATETAYRGGLTDKLRAAGAAVVEKLSVYRWQEEDTGPIDWNFVRWVVLASPRALRRFSVACADAPLARLTALCVGSDLTSKAQEVGFGSVQLLDSSAVGA